MWDTNKRKEVFSAYDPRKEHWDIRWHKDSPCMKCKTFKCPEMSPYCNDYREFLIEQLKLQNERQEKIDNIITNSYLYKNRSLKKDDQNGKSRRINKNNKNNKSDRRK